MIVNDDSRSVLLVHRYFWPENVSLLPLMFGDIAAMHLGTGARVDVVCGSSADVDTALRDGLGDRLHVHSFVAALDRNGGAVRRIANSVRLLIGGLRHLFVRRWDVMYTVSYPPVIATVLLAVAKFAHRSDRRIFYVQDNLSYRINSRLLKRVYQTTLAAGIRFSTATITLSQEMSDELSTYTRPKKSDGIAGKIHVLNNFSLEIPEQAPSDAHIAHDFIYAGNHGHSQNLGLFLEALAHIDADARPTAVFFGEGEAKAGLVALTHRLGLSAWVTFQSPVGRAEIALEIARARFGLVGAMPGLMRFAFPSKLLTYAAAGTPSVVMCESDGAMTNWLDATGLGAAVDPADPVFAARQLRRLLDAPEAPSRRSDIIKKAAHIFSRDAYLRQLQAIIEETPNPNIQS